MRRPTLWAPPTTAFTHAHVAPLGVTARMIEGALADGRITGVRRGVYIATTALPTEPIALHLLAAAAEQLVNRGLVVSHASAAMAHELPTTDAQIASGPLEFTTARHPSARSINTDHRHIHVRDLPAHHEVQLASGLVVTSVARTALDVASRELLPEALMIADAAARCELANLQHGTPQRRDYESHRLREAAKVPLLEALRIVGKQNAGPHLTALMDLVDVRRESPLESFSAGHMHMAGIPRPVLQARIRTPQGTYYGDFLWEEFGVIGEADGASKYGDPNAIVREKNREAALTDLGFQVVRWTGSEIFRSPQVTMERIFRALAAHGWVATR